MAGASSELRVKGLRELNRTIKKMPDDARKAIRAEYRSMAEPVRSTAESLASQMIGNVHEGDPWSKMRTGITQKVVYVAPRQKGVRGRTRGQRRNMAGLLAERALEPALERHRAGIEADFDRLLDRLVRDWNRDR